MSDSPEPRPASPSQLAWLRGEVAQWQRAGLVGPDAAAAILAGYHESRRFTVGRLLLTLGAAFVGVGLIWLVAANLDQLPPLARFLAVTLLWLALLTGAALLGERPGAPRAIALALHLLAALAFGAVVFQAAQSLQVPAYEPRLVGVWAAGALVHGYVLRAVGPVLVGVVAGSGWLVWQVLWTTPELVAGVLALTAVGVIGLAAAALHRDEAFAAAWREPGVLASLTGLFVAALPFGDADTGWSLWLVAGLLAAAVLTALALAQGEDRLEPLAAVAVALLALGLVLWDTGTDADGVGAADWAHAAVSVVVYVLAAVGVAVLGARHDSWRLTAMATGALVVFTTFQSFSVFAELIQGAWLFVVLGLVFLGTGVGFDRARRRLAASLQEES